jgi:hypothetical protein
VARLQMPIAPKTAFPTESRRFLNIDRLPDDLGLPKRFSADNVDEDGRSQQKQSDD